MEGKVFGLRSALVCHKVLLSDKHHLVMTADSLGKCSQNEILDGPEGHICYRFGELWAANPLM